MHKLLTLKLMGGHNIVDRKREWEKERGWEREPMQTTKECSPSLSAAALYPPVVGCVIAPQLKCLCLGLCGVHVCVCVCGCVQLATLNQCQQHSQFRASGSEKDSIREEFPVLVCSEWYFHWEAWEREENQKINPLPRSLCPPSPFPTVPAGFYLSLLLTSSCSTATRGM